MRGVTRGQLGGHEITAVCDHLCGDVTVSGSLSARRGQTGGYTQCEGRASAIPQTGSGESLLFPDLEKEATLTPTGRFSQPNENLLCSEEGSELRLLQKDPPSRSWVSLGKPCSAAGGPYR